MPQTDETLAELLDLFPQLETLSTQDIAMARPIMMRREAVLLAA